MNLLGKPIYRFDGVEIDPSAGTIKRAGGEDYLRQQTFQVLLYLLEHCDRIVSKEELIENIWEGTAVTDNALVQCIADIRRALGDDSRQPRFVKTLPKLGYRFISAVEIQWPAGTVTLATEEITTVEIELKEKDAKEILTLRGAACEQLLLPTHNPPDKVARQRLMLIASAASLILVIAFGFLVYPGKALLRSGQGRVEVTLPQVEGKKSVAVMHFENLSGSPELDWMREGIADMLITDLSRSTKLTVLGRQQLHLLIERLGHNSNRTMKLDDALQIAQASHAEVVVLGSFASVGDAIHISVQLYDARSNQALASERIAIDRPKDIINEVDLLSLKLASHLGASIEGQETARGLTNVMTNNLEAYRNYSLAVERTYGMQNAEAIALLERAVSVDPQFAMAYARIGYAYAVRWSFAEKAKPYLEKAFQLSDRLTEKDRLTIAGWYSIANSDFPGAIRYFLEIIARYPLEVEAYCRLSNLLQGEERFEEAADAAKRGLAVDPDAKELYNQLGAVYNDWGRFDEAIGVFQRYVALAPNEPNAYDSLGLSYQAAGRYDEAQQSYERALALRPDFEVALIHLANVYFQQGRYREAINHYKRYIQIAPSEVERQRGYDALCDVYLRRGEIDRADEAGNKSIKAGNPFSCPSLVVALQRGEEAKVGRLKEHFLAHSVLVTRGARETPRIEYYCKGYLALKSGQAAEAIEDFKEALKHRPPYWNLDSYEDCLANAYLELGRPDEAIAEYERVLTVNPNYPLAHYHLAQAYERKGEAEGARAEYERFMQVWKDADRDLQEVIIATQRLAAGT